jgi:prepilin-type N-terminal cleavage/methylation domain-containing protein
MLNKFKKNKQGFTLIELMTVMAIIAILATAIIMSLSSHKKRAEGSKALTELSAVMQNIYLCIADEGLVSTPSSNGTICTISGVADLNYGTWPSMTVNLAGYTYGVSNFAVQPWVYSVTKVSDAVTVCCNSTSGRCQKFNVVHACTATEALN